MRIAGKSASFALQSISQRADLGKDAVRPRSQSVKLPASRSSDLVRIYRLLNAYATMSTQAAIITGFGTVAAAGTSSVARGVTSIMDRFGRNLSLRPVENSVSRVAHDFSQLEAEVVRLGREHAQIAAENQLLNEMIGRSGQAGASRFLRRLVPQVTDGLAALLDVSTSSPIMLAIRGTSVNPNSAISISERAMDQLQRESLLVRRFEVHASAEGRPGRIAIHDSSAGLERNAIDRVRSGEMFLIPIKEDDRLAGVLATTAIWPGGLRRNEQVEMLGRLGRTLVRQFQQERQLDQHQTELWLAKEMLRLKSMTDRATDQPLETLGEFIAELCDAVEMDRAALFLVSRRAGEAAEPVVEAGAALPPTIAQEWRRHENQLAEGSLAAVQGELFTKPRLESMGFNTLWGQAVAWPLQSAGKRLGTLVMSRRNKDRLPEKNQRLIEWSADLLAQTLRRIYRDAAIRRQARHDGLTDLANRRTFDTLLAGEVDRVRLGLTEECSLLLADLDRFKCINDRHGHQAGDEVLRVIAQLLREHVGRMRVGERSLLARYGGEELAILLPGVGTSGALRVAEEIRVAIERLAIVFGDKRLGVTVSIGVASCPMHGLGAADLVASADAALYRAKSEGRNRVCRPLT